MGTIVENRRREPSSRTVVVFVGYVVAALVMTWPLALGMHRDVPGDLGDSLLNLWILGWGAENVPRLLTGQISLADYWNANIFHPEPLALSLSEHLFGQVLQILPVYWLTGNLILAYNLLFVTSFALSGVGMYLLVRDLLGEGGARGFNPAAFIAGLIFAFLPFRIAQVAHIQSLSAQWMPFALYGFVRYTRTGDWRWLAGGSLALLMQNWSCGYYLIFFAPFVPLFAIHQMWTAGRLRDGRMWMAFAAAAALAAVGTWPFLALYLDAQRIHGFERSVGEVIRYSADVYSYLTAPETLRVWGGVLQAYPKPEGELFFGVVPWVLAAVAIAALGAREKSAYGPVTKSRASIALTWILLAILAVQTTGFIAILFTGGFVTSFAGIPIRATNPLRILTGIAIAAALLLAISPRARRHARDTLRSPAGFCLLLMLMAMWLSLGPMAQSRGRTLPGLGLYAVLYEYVPGFEGLRVPARYAMIAGLFLSVVAGFGAAALLNRVRAAAVAAAGMAVAFLIEVAFVPMPLNLTWGDGAVAPPPRVEQAADAPPVYHQLATMPAATVVAEFPFGDPAWELRYVYYATVHWKRLVNGYSGAFPHGYKVRVALLQRIAEHPDEAWRALREAGTTHVVVHEAAFAPGEGAVVTRWLDDHFAVEIARFGSDVLYDVSGVWPPS
ncbi:MAG TPA: hypothetical protein VMO26_08340 [Vicinamibacterales bacterium]|nr:hypothetical protein [Vicinamibacterales bacterium]